MDHLTSSAPAKRRDESVKTQRPPKPGKEIKAVEEAPHHLQQEPDYWDVARQNLKKFMAHSLAGQYYDNALLLLSVVSCFEYIYQTYLHHSLAEDRKILWRLNILELIFASIFGFDWCLNCFMAEHRILFFTSFFSMVDVLTVIPIFVTFGTEMPNVNYIYNASEGFLYTAYAMNTTRILRALRIRRKLAKIEDAVERFMGELMLSIIVMILFFASVMQFLEYTYQPHTYHTWMYYIWVTISTVGYGDITPKSTQGRVAVMCIIGFSIISIPKMTNELIEKMALQTVYMRNTYTPKSKNSKHIVICGDISSISLNEFFAELFHEDHENVDLNAILLLPSPPTTEMIFLLRDSSFFLNLQYLEGSALIDNDLKRAKAHLALAIFIMTNKFSNKPDEEDAKSILLNLSIKRYVASFHLPPKLFCLQLIRPSNRKHLGRDGPSDQQLEEKDLVVCLNEIKMGVLAKAVMYPGANTLLMNLISSFSDDEIPEGEEGGAGQSSKWLSEYKQGCGWEIYTTPLAPRYHGKRFCELSYELYKRIGLILFALQITDNASGRSRMYLNPAEYVIPDETEETVLAFVIAENKQSSDLSFNDANSANNGWLDSCLGAETAAVAYNTARRDSEVWMRSRSAGLTQLLTQKDSADMPPRSNSPAAHAGSPAALDFGPDESGFQAQHMEMPPTARPSTIDIHAPSKPGTQNEVLIHLKENHFRSSYYLRDHQILLKEATVKGSILDTIPNLTKHIIIIGKGLTNLFDLIRPLRAKYFGVLRHIVILTPDTIEHDVWSRIAMFDAVSVVRGSPLEERNLRRAGIFQAKRVVVLADGTADSSSKASSMAALVDSDAIFSYQRVRKMNPKAQVVIEMINTTNIGYLYTPAMPGGTAVQEQAATDYKFSTQFAAGELFTTSLLDSIVCQGYYNPHIINVIDKLISGVDLMTRSELITNFHDAMNNKSRSFRAHSSKFELKDIIDAGLSTPGGADSEAGAGMILQGSCLYQIPLSPQMVGKSYGSLYKRLSKKGIVPLGLLRGTGSPDLVAPYVYTNPSYDTELNAYDRVFILSVRPVPDERDISSDEKNVVPPKIRKDSLFNPLFSGSMAEGLALSSPQPTQDFSAVTAAQSQLRQDLQALSSDVNKKFDALLTLLQPPTTARAPASSSGAASASAPVPDQAAQSSRPMYESRGPVRLAPLQHPNQAATLASTLPASTSASAAAAVQDDAADKQSDATSEEPREDSFPNDAPEVYASRSNSTGSGIFAFAKNRSRSRGSSIGIDNGFTLTDAEVAAAIKGVIKNKPNYKS